MHLPYGSIWDVTYEQVTSDCRIGRGEPAGHFAKTWRLQVAKLCKPPHVMRMRKAVSGMEFAQICSLLLRSHLTREIELMMSQKNTTTGFALAICFGLASIAFCTSKVQYVLEKEPGFLNWQLSLQ